MMTKLPLDVHVLTVFENNPKSLIFQHYEWRKLIVSLNFE